MEIEQGKLYAIVIGSNTIVAEVETSDNEDTVSLKEPRVAMLGKEGLGFMTHLASALSEETMLSIQRSHITAIVPLSERIEKDIRQSESAQRSGIMMPGNQRPNFG